MRCILTLEYFIPISLEIPKSQLLNYSFTYVLEHLSSSGGGSGGGGGGGGGSSGSRSSITTATRYFIPFKSSLPASLCYSVV
jgi:uncharacterized membrane protein YgcG